MRISLVIKALPKQFARILTVMLLAGMSAHYLLKLKLFLHGGFFFENPIFNNQEIYYSIITITVLCTLVLDTYVSWFYNWLESKLFAKRGN